MGNGNWEMGTGNGKLKIVEIVVKSKLNFLSGYYHNFWKRFAPKKREFADDQQQTGEMIFLSHFSVLEKIFPIPHSPFLVLVASSSEDFNCITLIMESFQSLKI